MKNAKTTILGILTILGALCTAGIAMLDGDPETVANYPAVVAAITAGIGLITAKDGDK